MSLRFGVVALALLASASIAAAAADERIRIVPYRLDTIVELDGQPDFQSMVSFAEDERIENVALGDSTNWQVAPNKRANLLFVKPVLPETHTNMTVVTNQRTYLFELRSGSAVPAVYSLRFEFPQPPAATATATGNTSGNPAAPASAPAPSTAAPQPRKATARYAWRPGGSANLQPRGSFDDGRTLFVAWPKGIELPAILSLAADGAEESVNYVIQGDYLAVEGLPKKLVLRVGRDEAVLSRAPLPRQSRIPADWRVSKL